MGASLGARRGAASLTLYVLLGLFLPFYADGESGWHVVWGASGGYLIGFVFAAAFVGWMAENGADRVPLLAFLTFVVGQLIIFVPGLIVLKISVGETWGWTIHNGFSIFIVGGLVKAATGCDRAPGGVGARATIRTLMPEFLVRAAANLAAIWVAAAIFDGVTYGDSFWTLCSRPSCSPW